MISIVQETCDKVLSNLGHKMARKLHTNRRSYVPCSHLDFERLCQTLLPGDILLVEGNERISGAIKYLTQSTWSHAALFVGQKGDEELPSLIEVNLHSGCVVSPLEKYRGFNSRICRASALSDAERTALVAFMKGKIGMRYDLRNIFDLLRFLLPTPPLPARWRRRMLSFGSGDPTRAICSSLIAQAFQSINYPILPEISVRNDADAATRTEIFRIRHNSLFAPRDFDLSPYFDVVKPALGNGFDFRKLIWD